MTEIADPLQLLEDLIAKAKAAGAEAADALLVDSIALSHAQRLGALERLEREESHDLGLRVLIGRHQAIASTTDTTASALADLVERAVAMARAVPEDQYCGLAEPGQLAGAPPTLDILDDEEPAPELLIERAKACEEAARAVAGITNSEGAEASWHRSAVALVASNGFAGRYAVSRHGLGVAVVATSIGAGLAWLVVMTDAPGRALLGALAIVPFALPTFSLALAWESVFRNDRLGEARAGLLQTAGLDIPDWLAWGQIPVIATLAAHYSSLAFLLIAAALASTGGDLHEAAELTGASRRRIARAITFVPSNTTNGPCRRTRAIRKRSKRARTWRPKPR